MNPIIYAIGQGFGFVAIALGFLSFQMKNQKQLLLVQTATSFVFVIHYLLIGAWLGMALNAVNVIRNIVFYFRDKSEKKGWFIPIAFAVLLGAIGILTWDAWYSVLAITGIVVNTLFLAMPEPQQVRKSILVTSPMVLIYDAFVHSYGGMLYESVAVISSAIGIVRHHRQRKEEK